MEKMRADDTWHGTVASRWTHMDIHTCIYIFIHAPYTLGLKSWNKYRSLQHSKDYRWWIQSHHCKKDQKIKAFLPRLVMTEGFPLLIPLFYIVLEYLARAIEQESEIKTIQLWRRSVYPYRQKRWRYIYNNFYQNFYQMITNSVK